jgi:predicted Zn-dependent protease
VEYDPRLPAEGINSTGENALSEFALLVFGLLGAAAAFLAIAALAIDHLVPMVPPQLEARWFAGLIGLAHGDAEDPRAAAVQGLLDRIAAHWSERPFAFRVGVLDEPEPNALALPGGAILVTSGLLEQVRSENELALVLGHELGHFRARDHLRGLGRGLALELVLDAFGGEPVVTGMAGLAGQLAQRGFDRHQESEADAFGLELVAAEYGHVAGAGDFFARLAASAQGDQDAVEGYLGTHPLHAERIAALHAEAAAHGWPEQGPLTPWTTPPE